MTPALRLVLVLCLLSLFVAACVPQMPVPNARVTPPRDPEVSPPVVKTLDTLYHHDRVKAYEYRSTSYTADKPIITSYKHTVESSEYDGTSAWLITVWAEFENQQPSEFSGITQYWFAKEDERCLNAQNVVLGPNGNTTTPAQCSPSVTLGNPQSGIYPYIRDTQVKLPLGTFDVAMYGIEGGVIYFIDPNVPVPVMATWGKGTPGPGTIYMELVSYS